MSKFVNLVGKTFGLLSPLRRVDDYYLEESIIGYSTD